MYLLQFHEATVVLYLYNLDLSRQARITLASLLDQIRVYAEAYIKDSERRLAPDSDCFRVDLIFRDPVSKIIHQLRLIVSDAAAAYGILRIVFAEDETGSMDTDTTT